MSRSMKSRPSKAKPLFRVALGAAAVATLILARDAAPGALASMPIFTVTEHEFHGLQYMVEDRVLRTAGIDSDANLWEDPEEWVERLERHPLVARASVERRFPSTLVIRVEERRPVGLVPTPTLRPVDHEGRYLPLDPSRFPLDFPVLRPARGGIRGNGRPASVHVRPLAQAAAAMRGESDFWSEVSEVVAGDHGGVDVWWGQPEVLFQFPPEVEGRRIRVGLEALKNAEERTEGRRPLRVDLRYGEKVFLDWSPADFDRTGDS